MGSKPSDKARYDARMGLLLRTVTRIHRVVYALSGGRIGRRFPGGAVVVWITSLGRRSGQWRRNPLLGAPDRQYAQERGLTVAPWVVAGSNAGQEKVPAWVHNVRAQAHGWIEVDGNHYRAVFEELTEAQERDRCYALLVSVWGAFRSYRQVADRDIPVFRVHVGERVDRSALPALGT
jgi:deazaflavin-dependent oxidoreductase (nitroreductase family)